MGLYDEIIVDYALDVTAPENIWQSVNLTDAPHGYSFRLDAEGNLWRYFAEMQPEKPDPLMWKIPRGTIVTPNVEYSGRWERSDLSKKVGFYQHIDHRETRLMWEYEAVFEKGALKSLTRVKPRKIPS